jgi:hypothetical protein
MFNDVTAKCAEDLVLSSAKSEEVAAMVARCARFRVEAEYVELPAAPTSRHDCMVVGSARRIRGPPLVVPEGSAPPISLGVISLVEPTMSPWLATYAPNDLVHARLAVSLEPPGGSPNGIPTGPTMFVGTLVQTIP